MAIKLIDGFACSICGKVFPQASQADVCREQHDMLYIPMSRTELNRLLNALVLNQVELVPDSLYTTLRKYTKIQSS